MSLKMHKCIACNLRKKLYTWRTTYDKEINIKRNRG